MNEITILIGIGAAILIGAVVPGPSFVVVSRISVSTTRLDGIIAALGMGVGGLAFAVVSLLGLTGFLLAVPSAYLLLKVVGGGYLIYLGIRTWIGAGDAIPELESGDSFGAVAPLRSFIVSLTTHISNPKALIVYSGVFATFLPADPSLELSIGISLVVFMVETA